MKSTSKRTHGALLLARKGLKQAEIASRIGCSQAVVCLWLSGGRVPQLEHRAALKRAYGIPTVAWKQEPPATDPVKKKKPSTVPPDADDAVDDDVEIAQLAKIYRRSLVTVSKKLEEGRSKMTSDEILDALEKATRIIKSLSALTGEGQEVNEAKIMRLPAYQRVREATMRSLAPWPDALKAVIEALEHLTDSHA